MARCTLTNLRHGFRAVARTCADCLKETVQAVVYGAVWGTLYSACLLGFIATTVWTTVHVFHGEAVDETSAAILSHLGFWPGLLLSAGYGVAILYLCVKGLCSYGQKLADRGAGV